MIKSNVYPWRGSATISVADTAQYLGISSRTVHRRIEEGTIPSWKLGGRRLIPTSAIEHFIAHGTWSIGGAG